MEVLCGQKLKIAFKMLLVVSQGILVAENLRSDLEVLNGMLVESMTR